MVLYVEAHRKLVEEIFTINSYFNREDAGHFLADSLTTQIFEDFCENIDNGMTDDEMIRWHVEYIVRIQIEHIPDEAILGIDSVLYRPRGVLGTALIRLFLFWINLLIHFSDKNPEHRHFLSVKVRYLISFYKHLVSRKSELEDTGEYFLRETKFTPNKVDLTPETTQFLQTIWDRCYPTEEILSSLIEQYPIPFITYLDIVVNHEGVENEVFKLERWMDNFSNTNVLEWVSKLKIIIDDMIEELIRQDREIFDNLSDDEFNTHIRFLFPGIFFTDKKDEIFNHAIS